MKTKNSSEDAKLFVMQSNNLTIQTTVMILSALLLLADGKCMPLTSHIVFGTLAPTSSATRMYMRHCRRIIITSVPSESHMRRIVGALYDDNYIFCRHTVVHVSFRLKTTRQFWFAMIDMAALMMLSREPQPAGTILVWWEVEKIWYVTSAFIEE